ncbi:MAG: beta-N-acetylhexosaminidase [Acidobacteriota bacterium]
MANSIPSSLAAQCGQIVWLGLEGTMPTAAEWRTLKSLRPGGITLFRRNIQDADQLRRLNQALNERLQPAPFLAVDQEGGRVSRLDGILPTLPPPAAWSPGGDSRRVYELAYWKGMALRALGFSVNFAPCADLSEPGESNGIGDRAFGRDRVRVARLAYAYLRGLAAAGVAGCVKHFPGLGSARVDSHHALPRIDRDRPTLWRQDLFPFRCLARLSPMVMVAHAHYPSIMGETPWPASLSRIMVERLLRRRLGYEGLILTDDLQMGGVTIRHDPEEVAVRALMSGSDVLLYCRPTELAERALRALLEEASSSASMAKRLQEAVARVMQLKRILGLWPPRPRPTASLPEANRRLGALVAEMGAQP